jgi:hypothetical protein
MEGGHQCLLGQHQYKMKYKYFGSLLRKTFLVYKTMKIYSLIFHNEYILFQILNLNIFSHTACFDAIKINIMECTYIIPLR